MADRSARLCVAPRDSAGSTRTAAVPARRDSRRGAACCCGGSRPAAALPARILAEIARTADLFSRYWDRRKGPGQPEVWSLLGAWRKSPDGRAGRRCLCVFGLLAALTSPSSAAHAQQSETSPAASPSLTTQVPASPLTATPPTTLPTLPSTGFSFGAAPTTFAGTGPPAAEALPGPQRGLGLGRVFPGAIPLQANDARAPAILVMPSVAVQESFTDNARFARNGSYDFITRVSPGVLVSADTPRLQGQLSASIDYQKFARADDLDTLSLDLVGLGLLTVLPERFFIDGRASITQFSNSGIAGLTNTPFLPATAQTVGSQQTQTRTVFLSPFVRGSFNDYVDAEIRYSYASTRFDSGTLLNGGVANVPGGTTLSNIADTDENTGSVTLATGQRFTRLTSRLTLSATDINSQSTARSTQVRAFDEVEYQINPQVAALGGFGYENIRYPLSPGSNTSGPIWQVGTRLTSAADPGDFIVVRYGRQAFGDAFSGALTYHVTPATVVLASLENSLTSVQQQIVTNLSTAQLGPGGTLIGPTGLPQPLANPALANAAVNIYRDEIARVGVQTTFERDTYGIFGFIDHREPAGNLGPGNVGLLAGSDTTRGVAINWSRSISPVLTSFATVGYSSAVASHSKSLTADLSLSYTMTETLSSVLHYQFINVATDVSGLSYSRNLIELGIRKSF